MTATFLAIIGAALLILTVAGWVADDHGGWLDHIPGIPKDGE